MPGELLFEFVRELDHARFRCELRSHGEWGIEAQWFKDGDFLIAHQFDTRVQAVLWAEAERVEIEKGWR